MKCILRTIGGLSLILALAGFTFATPKVHPYHTCVRSCLGKTFSDSACQCQATCLNTYASYAREDYHEAVAACTVQCQNSCRMKATLSCLPGCSTLKQ
jgi:hypothetical protein